MMTENSSQRRCRYGPYEGYESRRQRRLQIDLGVDLAAVEVIQNLTSQVIALQSYICQLETDLNTQSASQTLRLACFQETYYEATWIELEL